MKRCLRPLLITVCAAGLVLTGQAQSTYTPYSFTTFVGNPPGSTDDTGTAARFDGPFGLAIGIDGNVYFADSNNNTIRKVTPNGPQQGVVTTLAGLAGASGSADGTGDAARFLNPKGVGVDSLGNVYVADSSNNTIRKVTPAGKVTTLAGLAGVLGSADGKGSLARFNFPTGVAVDSGGSIYVADNGNHTIRKIASDADATVSTLAGSAGQSGSADGPGDVARFNAPGGVAVDKKGNVYVADTDNYTIRKIASDADATVSTLAGMAGSKGSLDAIGTAARFSAPGSVGVDGDLNVYVADTFNHTIRKIDSSAMVTTLAGSPGMIGSVDGLGEAARFNKPRGVTVGPGGFVYVADTENNTMRQITFTGAVSTLAGSAGTGSEDGTGTAARFTLPASIAVNSEGTLYTADNYNQTIRKITSAGEVSTLAGTPGVIGSDDGTGGEAQFNFPVGVAVDADDNIYVADRLNNTIRKITPDGVVTTIAGAPPPAPPGSSNDPPRFNGPSGVAVGDLGNIYVTDTGNNTIRKIDPGGTVTTLAGTPGVKGSADGNGSAALFNAPAGIAVHTGGILYVADSFNCTIRRVAPSGDVSTPAGLPLTPGGRDGTGTAARFYRPKGVAVGSDGNIYVADTLNDSIRILTPEGVVKTLAGSFGRPGGADGTGRAARFHFPTDVAVDSAGTLYVADHVNNTIRVGVPAPPVITSPESATGVVGQQFVYQFLASGASSLATSNLPAGLTFDAEQLAIVGSPTGAGTFLVGLSATNSIGTTDMTSSLVVQAAGSATLNRIGATGAIGQSFRYQVRVSGIATGTTVTTSPLPAGLVFDEVTGLISGVLPDKLLIDETSELVVATPSQDGSSLIKVTIPGSDATADLQLAFTSDPAVPVITSTSEVNLMAGQPFTYQITVQATADPAIYPVTYELQGKLPAGLSFDRVTGTISGTARASLASQPGPLLSDIETNAAIMTGNGHGKAVGPITVTPGPSSAQNISTRLSVGVDDDVLIGGFILTGDAPTKVIIRAIGPSLTSQGLNGVLRDPTLELFDKNGLSLAYNDNWRDSDEQEIIGTTIPPSNNRESAIVAVLASSSQGEPYTAILRGKDDTTGVGLVEVYDLNRASLSASSQSQVANISTRGKVQSGDKVMIGGFIIPDGSWPDVVVRAIGPSLTGVQGPLLDPTLDLRNSDGDMIDFDDNWKETQQKEINAAGLAPTDDRESAIVMTLAPGAYTAIVRGQEDTVGVALVEAYVLQ